MRFILICLGLCCACLAQAPRSESDSPDLTCNELLDFARSNAKTYPEGSLSVSTVLECAKLAKDRTRRLWNFINLINKPGVVNGAIRAPDSSDPEDTKIPADARFFAFKPTERVSEVASRFRRDIQTLLEAVNGSKNLFVFPHPGTIERVIIDDKDKPKLEETRSNLVIADADINQILDQLDLLEPFSALLQTYLVACRGVIITGNDASYSSGLSRSNVTGLIRRIVVRIGQRSN